MESRYCEDTNSLIKFTHHFQCQQKHSFWLLRVLKKSRAWKGLGRKFPRSAFPGTPPPTPGLLASRMLPRRTSARASASNINSLGD
jgi:hypothetical protein